MPDPIGVHPKSQLEKRLDAIPNVYIQGSDPSVNQTMKNGDYWIVVDDTVNKYLQSLKKWENGSWELMYTAGGGGGGGGGNSLTVNISHAILIQKA